MISDWIKNGRFSIVFRTMLVICDIFAINFSSYIALLVRFEFRWSAIEPACLQAVNSLNILNTIITLLIFFVFRLYNSLWRYASVRELVNIIIACVVAPHAGANNQRNRYDGEGVDPLVASAIFFFIFI